MNLQQLEIKRLFEEEYLPIYKIGKLLGITQSRVRQALRESGIDCALIFNDSDEIKEIIRPCGLSPKKSQAISELSKIIIEKHDGIVPKTFEELEALPGVGHKTASVVMSQAFDVPAFPVDTHIHRLATRWGLTSGKNVTQTEADLKKHFPKTLWNKLHLQIIFFGREYCQARAHDPKKCPICSVVSTKEK